MTTTAGDQINRALRLLGVLAEGETASADTSQDALIALNQMIDSWNTERLMIYNTIDQIFTWPAGEIQQHLGPTGSSMPGSPILTTAGTPTGLTYTYSSGTLSNVVITDSTGGFSCDSATLTVGMTITISGTAGGTGSITGYSNPSTYYVIETNGSTTFRLSANLGGFDGIRPVLLDDATYYRDPSTNVSFGIKFINQQQYDGIAVKTVTSTYPQVMWINMEYPNIQMTVYPKPTRALEWHFISVQELAQAESLATELTFPPGYLRAFVYNLAMELAPEFGVEPSAQVQRIAMTSKRNLKRINNPDDVMSMPYSIVATRQKFNIYSGNY